jgi:hypothetical protein
LRLPVSILPFMAQNQISLAPDPSALIEGLRCIGYTLETAIADIIDNSITADATSISVRFSWENGNPWIAVSDNGIGMSRKELTENMRFGCKNPNDARSKNDLGRFGLGMKTASFSQCRRMTVLSKSSDSGVSGCEWDLDRFSSNPNKSWNAFLLGKKEIKKEKCISTIYNDNLDGKTSGTIVCWRNMDITLADMDSGATEESFSSLLYNARKHLECVFHRFLQGERGLKKVSIDFNGAPLVPFDPFGPQTPSRQELPPETLQVLKQKISIQPFILPHQSKAESQPEYEKYAGEEGYLQNQGFYVYRNKRLIIRATWFRLLPKKELTKLVRIRVDIPNSLDHLWQIDVKKSQAAPPQTVKNKLKQFIGRCEFKGKRVYTSRATRIRDRNLTPVWRREIVNGAIQYVLNEEYPLRKKLYDDSNGSKDILPAYLELIDQTFPYDSFYADAASDDAVFAENEPDETEMTELGVKIARALLNCGVPKNKIEEHLKKTEPISSCPELIDRILIHIE